jgi:hypothetical protein
MGDQLLKREFYLSILPEMPKWLGMALFLIVYVDTE